MQGVVAGTYEMIRELGSGGGGIVYLARHLRLGKLVVLKADKRTLSTKPEVLRREVDALKNLSHTYIPQVYDFIAEDGVVYTVMDYIEGESFDKPLKRGERFPQPKVVEWACQLLEALRYLHSRPPHGILHSDIKPANIMLTPQGDVRLIDFNIALALGEEGAVKVGLSRGYASPEHYGLDLSAVGTTQNTAEEALTSFSTSVETEASGTARTSGRRTVLLDVRSDIYSLGATLYHILSGARPAQDAREVAPIAGEGSSPLVVEIVRKAMDPDPALRYQSAEEMLHAFEHLRENDPRTRRHRRRAIAAAGVLSVLFLLGGFSAFTGLKQMEQLQTAYALSEYAQNALRAGDTAQAVSLAMEALSDKGIFGPPHTAQAQKALTDALGVYDLSDGFKAAMTLELPSEPFKLALAPGGGKAAVVYAYETAVFDTATGEILATLPMERSALADAVFLDDRVLIYAGEGALRAYDTELGKELWSGKPATRIAVSGDGSTVAAVYQDDTVGAVYDAVTGRAMAAVTFDGRRQRGAVNDSFADPGDSLFALDQDGTRLAVSFDGGALMVFDLKDRDKDLEIYDVSEFTHFEGGFSGKYFAFSGTNSEGSVFAVVDMEEMAQTGGFASKRPFLVQADESGIYVATDNILVKLDPETGDQEEVAYTDKDITGFQKGSGHTATALSDGSFALYDRNASLVNHFSGDTACHFIQAAGETALAASRDTPILRILRLENHSEAQIFSYDPAYEHDEARLSADGSTVMLFRYDGFRLYDLDGTVIAEENIPDAEQVYDQQYRRDGQRSWLEVVYNDGTVRSYSAETGALLSETTGDAPDPELYEEFFTDTLRIAAPLHGTPIAYDLRTGKQVCELEKDAYLTYVTQIGDRIITEYISTDGRRYALLLNERCEALAYLPDLCDIIGEELIFDHRSGSIRKSEIYSLEQLMTLANK